VEEPWTVEDSEEVATWYRTLAQPDRMIVDRMVHRLSTFGSALRMPHSRPLGDGLFELRFALQRGTVDQRITYVFDLDKRIITLTTFRKTKSSETRQVGRARRAQHEYHEEENT
jgi:hypothetical protein